MTAPDTTPAAVAAAVARWRDHARVYGERHAPPDGGHGAAMLGEAADLIDALAAERDALAAALAACERERDAAEARGRTAALAEVDAAFESIAPLDPSGTVMVDKWADCWEVGPAEGIVPAGECLGPTPTAALFAAAAALPPAAPADAKE